MIINVEYIIAATAMRSKVYLNVDVHVSVFPFVAAYMSDAIMSGEHKRRYSARENGRRFVIYASAARGYDATPLYQKSAKAVLLDATVLTVSPNRNTAADAMKNGENRLLSLCDNLTFIFKQSFKNFGDRRLQQYILAVGGAFYNK